MRNVDKILKVIQQHPDGIDDDEISTETRISPRQQVYQICSKLAAEGRIDRRSVDKLGKRKKIHNFPVGSVIGQTGNQPNLSGRPPSWERRLAALQAATGCSREDLLDRAISDLALKVLANDFEMEIQESKEGDMEEHLTPRNVPFAEIWRRIEKYQGEEFHQIRGKPFTFEVRGGAITPSTTNWLIPRSNFEVAFGLVPLNNTVPVQHLQGPSYIFAIMMDPRVREDDW